jgi:ADP-ribose pyrophosphatase YjhB (NUDIX family)
LKPFNYCPACAAALEKGEEEGGLLCPQCGRTWYRNAAPTAGCTFIRDGKALVSVRGSDPYKGKVDLPGGFLKPDEDPVTAVKREVKEELGIEIDVSFDDFIQAVPHRYGDEGDWTLAIGFLGRIMSGDPSPSDDVAAILWVGVDELDDVDWAWVHDKELVRKVLSDAEHRHG